MERKYIIFGLSFLVLVIVFFFAFMFNSNADESSSLVKDSEDVKVNLIDESSEQITVNISKVVLIEELVKHNSSNDCWVGFQNKSYDLTAWLPKHPGSARAILPYCGTAKEFEDAFIKKHGKTKVNFFMKVAIFIGDLKYKGDLNV